MRFVLDALEGRRLLSNTSLDIDSYFDPGEVQVIDIGEVEFGINPMLGTEVDDVITITRIDGELTLVNNGIHYAAPREILIEAKDGNDQIVIDLAEEDADLKITIIGGDGNDIIWGGATAERIMGAWGDDIINGRGGRDTIYGNDGNDSIRGGGSSDLLDGGAGYDTLRGDAGNDNICGGTNPDRLRGSDGNDRLEGGGGRDLIAGEAGEDSLFGGTGEDVLDGGSGADLLRGGRDFDNVYLSDADCDDFDFTQEDSRETWDVEIFR